VKRSRLVTESDLGAADAADERRSLENDAGDCECDELAGRVVCFELEAAIECPEGISSGVNLYSDDSSLTRLDDFLKKEVGGRASARCGVHATPDKRDWNRLIPRAAVRTGMSKFLLRQQQGCVPGVLDHHNVFEFLAAKNFSEITIGRSRNHCLRPRLLLTC
jgi:hypothetical protein